MKSYGQYCGLARGLDLIGDRWSLLIVRELALDDRRYGELQAGLPGIATNLLAERLRHLVAAGVIGSRPGPGATARYGLTPRGRELLPTLYALVRWATPEMLPGPAAGDREQPGWVAFAARAYLPGAPAEMALRIVLVCDDHPVRIDVRDGTVEVSVADDPAADVRVAASSWTLMGLVSGAIDLSRLSVVDPSVTVTATRSGRRSFAALLTHNAPVPAAP